MRLMIVLCAVAGLAGCKDEKSAPAAKATGSDTGGMNMGSNPAGVVPPTGPKLDCAKVVPQAVRDKFFKDYELTDQPKPQPWQGECTVKGKDPTANGIIMATCHKEGATPEGRDKAMAELKKMFPAAKDVPGVMQLADTQVTAYNETCQINVNVPAGIDPVAVVKELLPVVTGP
jgi:hypothetical protein